MARVDSVWLICLCTRDEKRGVPHQTFRASFNFRFTLARCFHSAAPRPLLLDSDYHHMESLIFRLQLNFQ
jgi:hypothetical protein